MLPMYAFPNSSSAFINAGNRKETLDSLWDSLALKFFRKWEAGVWDMEALGSESGVNWLFTDV